MEPPLGIPYLVLEQDKFLILNDGGREAAGYKGFTGDCVTRAFAIAADRPYQEVYDLVIELAKRERPSGKKKRSHPRTGVHTGTMRKIAEHYGMTWTPIMGIGTGATVIGAWPIPAGRHVLRLSKHVTAAIDGTLHDTFDPTRGGARTVYGYFSVPVGEQIKVTYRMLNGYDSKAYVSEVTGRGNDKHSDEPVHVVWDDAAERWVEIR